MDSKFTRTVHEHKATAREGATSHLDQHLKRACQDANDHEQTENDTFATSATAPTSPPSTAALDNDAMDIDQHPRKSTESTSSAFPPETDKLPGGLADSGAPPVSPSPPTKQEPVITCLICCDKATSEESPNPIYPCTKCTNAFCVPCLKNIFIDSCRDLSRMPPRCCNQIPLHHVRPYLNEDEVELFKAKYQEWGTPDPFYCPVARCSAFIPDHMLPRAKINRTGKQRVDSGIGTPKTPAVCCPKCETDICTNCRQSAHADEICKPLEFYGIDEQTAELIKGWGYKKCPKCGNGVKRMFGCAHMECRCGSHWCWCCLQGLNECDGNCDDEDDDDDDYSQYGPDEEEDVERNTPQPEDTTPSDVNLDHVFPHLSPASQAEGSTTAALIPAPDSATPAEEPATPPRIRNLDGGSKKYWEEQGLDFGDEPTDNYQDSAWNCYHNFKASKIKLDEAFDVPPNTAMECLKCWATVHPEVLMPVQRKDRFKYTTLGSKPGARRPRATSDMSVSTMDIPTTSTSMSSRLSASPASFHSSFTYNPHTNSQDDSQDDAQSRVLDLYGKTVCTGKSAHEDEEMPDWMDREVEDEPASRVSFATKGTPFSFAYECLGCRLVFCHLCKEQFEEEVEEWMKDEM